MTHTMVQWFDSALARIFCDGAGGGGAGLQEESRILGARMPGPGFLMELARSGLTFPTGWRRPLQIAHPASASPWPHQLLQYYCYNQKSPRPTSRWWVQPFGLSSLCLKISWKSGRSANSTSLVAPFIISKVFIGPRCPWGPIYGSWCL